MVMRTFHLVLALSFLYFAFCNAEDKKPYHVKKSSFCNFYQDSEVCSATGDKYDFHTVVKEIVDNVDKLSGKQKDRAKNFGVCSNAYKKAICSKPNQFCFDENDDSRAKSVCRQLSKECPAWYSDDDSEESCVKYVQRLSANLTCVNSDKMFEGYCPKPTRKVGIR